MKQVSILTHPFFGNYGGMLQAYALQQALAANGIDSTICQYYEYPKDSAYKDIARRIYNWTRFQVSKHIPTIRKKRVSDIYFSNNGKRFLKRYTKSATYEKLKKSTDVWIVGSDQVWRSESQLLIYYMAHSKWPWLKNKAEEALGKNDIYTQLRKMSKQ